MFANVTQIPGAVSSVESAIPSGEGVIVAEWYPCSGGVAEGWNFDGNTFTPPIPAAAATTLTQAQAAQQNLVSFGCSETIVGGFTSSALGAVYNYPSKPNDQSNLAASVLASILPGVSSGWTTPFWCADSTGAWAFRPHTAAQIQQVGQDAKTFVIAQQNKLASLIQSIAAAASVAAVETISW